MIAAAPKVAEIVSQHSPITVRLASVAETAAWDDYVLNHPQGSFFHLTAWQKSVQHCYGYKTINLVAMDSDGRICGVLPVTDAKTALFGHTLVSSAFSVGGGLLSSSCDATNALKQAIETMAEAREVACAELRGGPMLPGWVAKQETYAGFMRNLSQDKEQALSDIPRKKRADLRKAIKAAEQGQVSFEADASIADVFALYAASVRNLGTPVFSKKWLECLANNFSNEQVSFSLVRIGGKAVAGLVSFWHGDTVMPYYGGALPEARAHHAYDFLYWNIMLQAIERGVTKFDFGRSKISTGAYDYKTYWGFEPAPLTYQYYLVGAQKMPDVNPNNPKFAMATKLWKKLPLPMANLVGPFVARNFV